MAPPRTKRVLPAALLLSTLAVLFLFLVSVLTTPSGEPEYENAVTFQAELVEAKMTTSFPVLTILEDGAQRRQLWLQSDTLICASDGTVLPPNQATRLIPGTHLDVTVENTAIYEPETAYTRCYEIQVLE